jgi:hypothetical protein
LLLIGALRCRRALPQPWHSALQEGGTKMYIGGGLLVLILIIILLIILL